MKTAVTLFVLATAFALVSADVLDQSLDSYITTYKIPPTGVWQSFTPSQSGVLESVSILVGATTPSDPCRDFEGTLSIHAGEGKSGAVLSTQSVVSVSCVCNAQDCVSWQKWTLSTPVNVVSGNKYTFNLMSSQTGHSFRVGLMVVDSYALGTSNLAAPGYDFPFRTYMAASSASGVSGERSARGEDEGSSNSVTAMAVVGAVVIFVLVVVVIVAVMRRRRDKKWLSAEDAASALKSKLDNIQQQQQQDPTTSKKKSHFSDVTRPRRSRVYKLDYAVEESEDNEINVIQDNWMLKEAHPESERDPDTGSMHWRSTATMALPEGDDLDGSTCVDDFISDYMEDDDLTTFELPDQYDDHTNETAIMY